MINSIYISINSYFEKRSRLAIMAMGIAGEALVGFVDYISGNDLSVSIFYLLPLGLVSWFAGRNAGLLFSLASALIWLAADTLPGHDYSPFIPFWNTLVRLGFFLIVSLSLVALRSAHEHEKSLARTDSLTRVANGRLFQEAAANEMERARRHGFRITAVYLDVDDFKQVNDHFGHTTGDELLQLIAQTLANNVRRTDIVARLGGDEFAMLLSHVDPDTVGDFLERVRQELATVTKDHGWPATFSIGAVTFDRPPDNVDDLIRAADNIMYAVKTAGKNALRHEVRPHITEAGLSAH